MFRFHPGETRHLPVLQQRGKLLYVGKAKNLRHRLFTYKRAMAGRVTRKTSRLISLIASLEYELTGSEKEALLLENRWIRSERPPFNRINKQTEAYYFVYLRPGQAHLDYRLAMQIHDDTEPEYWYGCFKGHNPVRRSLGCLLQLLWMAENGVSDPHRLPVQLTRRLTPMRYRLSLQPGSPIRLQEDNVPEMIREWLLGRSCRLIDWLVDRLTGGGLETPFQKYFLEHYRECLERFYERKLVRHRLIREAHPEGPQRIIRQDELDDGVVRSYWR